MGRTGFLRLLRCDRAPRRRSGRAAADVAAAMESRWLRCRATQSISSDGSRARLARWRLEAAPAHAQRAESSCCRTLGREPALVRPADEETPAELSPWREVDE